MSVCLVYRKFLFSSEGCCILNTGAGVCVWIKVERGWRVGAHWFKGKLSQFPVGKGKW